MGDTGAFRIFAFESLGSTNDEAMDRLRQGDPGGFFVTAARQTGGRGRLGRRWESPPGNLYASLALVDPAGVADAAQLSLVSGVALADALRRLTRDDSRLSLKWPNDVLLEGAKIAGILLESATLSDGHLACVIGFGVNCRSHPEGLAYPAMDLAAAGFALEPDAVLAALADGFVAASALWVRGENFAAIRRAWLRFAPAPGTPIAVTTPRGRLEGRFGGLAPGGQLLLDMEDGSRVTVDAGDVFLPGIVTDAMHQQTLINANVDEVRPEGT